MRKVRRIDIKVQLSTTLVKKKLKSIPDMSKFRTRFAKTKVSSLEILRQLRNEEK